MGNQHNVSHAMTFNDFDSVEYNVFVTTELVCLSPEKCVMQCLNLIVPVKILEVQCVWLIPDLPFFIALSKLTYGLECGSV